MARNGWAVEYEHGVPFDVAEGAWEPELAPEGRREHDGDWLGKRVVFSYVLVKFDRYDPGSRDPWEASSKSYRGWARLPLAEPVEGMICGARTLQSGEYRPGQHTPDTILGPGEYRDPHLYPTQTHRAFVVTWDLWRRPVLVLSDDAKNPPLEFVRVETCDECGQTLPPEDR